MSRNDTKPLTNGHGNGSHGPITRADLEAKLRDVTRRAASVSRSPSAPGCSSW